MEKTTTFPAKKADQKCIAQLKQRRKGNVSDEILKLIRKELNEHPGAIPMRRLNISMEKELRTDDHKGNSEHTK